jgi:sugar lactone lactonase YvrE
LVGIIKIKQYSNNIRSQNPGANSFVNIFDHELLQGSGVTVNRNGVIFVADSSRHVIWKLKEGLASVVFAGKLNTSGYINGNANDARFNIPKEIVADNSDNLYVFDSGNHRIRKIDTNGRVTTVTQVDPSITDISMAISPSGDIYAIAL